MQHHPEGGAMIIELMQPHTHAGILYSPGRRIDLSDAAAQWLISIGVARPVHKDQKPTRAPRKE